MADAGTAPSAGFPGAGEPEGGFRAPVLRGVAWKAATRVVFEVTKLVVAVILARLLTPREYGLAGMVLVLMAFVPVLSGSALASVLVQRPEITELDRSTVFWMTLMIGAASTVLGVAASWPAAWFYGDPAVQPLFAAMSLAFVLSALGMTHTALLTRDMAFRSLELRAMAGMIVGGAVSIAAALSGFGPWALILQQVAAVTTSSIMLWAFADWRPQRRFSRRTLREVRAFGGHVSGTLMLFQLNQTADNVLIGRYLGASALGAYTLAYNVILVPFSRLSSPLHEVLYPVFSRLQDDHGRLRSIWLRVTRLLGLVVLPGMLSLIVLAPDLIPLVFGERWRAATPVVQILAWVGALFALQGLNSVVLQALGRTRMLFRYALVSFAGGLAAFVLGLHWGVVGVAACFAAVSTVIQPSYMVLTARAVGGSARECVVALAGPLAVAAAVAAGVGLVHELLAGAGAPVVASLLASCAAGLLILLPGAWLLVPDAPRELRRLRPGSGGAGAEPVVGDSGVALP